MAIWQWRATGGVRETIPSRVFGRAASRGLPGPGEVTPPWDDDGLDWCTRLETSGWSPSGDGDRAHLPESNLAEPGAQTLCGSRLDSIGQQRRRDRESDGQAIPIQEVRSLFRAGLGKAGLQASRRRRTGPHEIHASVWGNATVCFNLNSGKMLDSPGGLLRANLVAGEGRPRRACPRRSPAWSALVCATHGVPRPRFGQHGPSPVSSPAIPGLQRGAVVMPSCARGRARAFVTILVDLASGRVVVGRNCQACSCQASIALFFFFFTCTLCTNSSKDGALSTKGRRVGRWPATAHHTTPFSGIVERYTPVLLHLSASLEPGTDAQRPPGGAQSEIPSSHLTKTGNSGRPPAAGVA